MKPNPRKSNIVKKVLFILDYPLSEWKGTQRTVFEFANYLFNLGINVTLLENSMGTGYGLNASIHIPFKLISIKFDRIGKTKTLRNIIKTEKPDVVYAANIINPFIPTFGAKTIFGMHSLNVSTLPFMKVSTKIKFYFVQATLSVFSLIFWNKTTVMFHADNIDQVNWVKRIYFNRVKVCLVGLPVECISDYERSLLKQRQKNEKFTLLFFGALDRERGFGYFLKLIRFIDSIGEDIQFIIAGNGTMRNFAEEAAHELNNVKYIQNPSEEQKNEIMINSDLFVFPSWIENYSVTTVEAQLRGLPAIVLDCAPLRNIVKNEVTGYILSEPDLSEKIVDRVFSYLEIWKNSYDAYVKMRLNISNYTSRLCKNRVLPDFYDMLLQFFS